MLRSEGRRLKGTFKALLLLGGCSTSQAATTPDAGKCAPSAPRPNLEDDAGCAYFVDFACGPPKPAYDGCLLFIVDCADVCTAEAGFSQCEYVEGAGCADSGLVADAGQPVTIECEVCSGPGGRRPEGLVAAKASHEGDVLGRHFAAAAFLEAASVPAFERLAHELARHRAPRELVRAAERARRDEVRHARVAAGLAKRYGGRPAPATVACFRRRSLEAFARENAVEGCVLETYGALLATWQASHAADPLVRRAMVRIAADETRHAALAWAVAGWVDGRLDTRAKRHIARAVRAAARDLERVLSRPPPEPLVRDAGLPRACVAVALVRQLGRARPHPCAAHDRR